MSGHKRGSSGNVHMLCIAEQCPLARAANCCTVGIQKALICLHHSGGNSIKRWIHPDCKAHKIVPRWDLLLLPFHPLLIDMLPGITNYHSLYEIFSHCTNAPDLAIG